MMHRQDKFFSSRRNIALAVIFAASAFGLLYTPVRSAFTDTLYIVAPGIWNIGGSAHQMVNSFFVNFNDKKVLKSENDALREEVSRMQAQLLDRNLLEEKVNSLSESLGRAQSDNRVVASVLSGPGVSPYDILVVDAGAENGINLGDMVVYAGSGVIGEIVEVSSATSKVKLYSSPKEEVFVYVGSRHIPIVAVGRGMGNFEVKVPQDSTVALGDNVLSSKDDLILGTVSLIEEKPAEPVKRVFFRTPFNITEIRSVEIVINRKI